MKTMIRSICGIHHFVTEGLYRLINAFALIMKNHCYKIIRRMLCVRPKITGFINENTQFFHGTSNKNGGDFPAEGGPGPFGQPSSCINCIKEGKFRQAMLSYGAESIIIPFSGVSARMSLSHPAQRTVPAQAGHRIHHMSCRKRMLPDSPQSVRKSCNHDGN